MKTHFCADLRQGSGLEVRPSHPHFDRAKWMLDSGSPNLHRIGKSI